MLTKQYIIEFIEKHLQFNYALALCIAVLLVIIYLYLVSPERKSGHPFRGLTRKDYLWGVILAVYITSLLVITLLSRTPGSGAVVRIDLFWSYRWTIKYRDWAIGSQIICNILLFIPWGILFPLAFKMKKPFRTTWLSGMLCSFGIEITQLLLQCGWCEIDDLMDNTLGVLIGYGICKLLTDKLDVFNRL